MSYPVNATELHTAEDSDLLAACRKGDTRAFEQLVLRYQRSLFNVAFRISGNEADAAEIVQETFLAVWRKIKEFRGEAKLSTWLTSIAVNQARTRWQQNRQKQGREKSLDETAEENSGAPLQIASKQPSALEQLERLALRELLERCIRALDQGFREVLVLRDMRELPYDEVGQVLGLREGTVKSRLFRAREAVRDCVTKGMA
ncbi:MAG: sigma-70 family RNA polymerase sigma factor [Trichlorobacter sp.]|uniref:RNA polymerase sigma factor n=1 Tax=Trichlorobacter sp. TaxID=2911007 RepID=UPI002561DFA5|nr:sigma-70 family RNA polymerase sigma factor [Trichlorobacter sp.]MDK9718326.1 sigma-70 family RNA polymerase sigma factor [Trichlorobacter sp.]